MAKYAQSQMSPRSVVRTGLKPFIAIVMALVVSFSVFGALFATIGAPKAVEKAEAWDPINALVCGMFPEEGIVRNAYQATQTDALYFDSQSKSAVSSGTADVTSGLNWILMASGMDFGKVNAGIIGQELEGAGVSLRPEAELSDDEKKENWNKGPQVSPFDRFGMAGTSFSSYNGEWKYYLVDACSDSDPVDLKEGAYYDGRLEAKSTWEDRSDSQDPRTVQHFKGETSRFWFGFVTLLSNLIFWVTKFITTITIAFINFSFSDMTEVLGLDGILSGDSADDGIFGHLFKNVYSPLIILALAATGMKILWDGGVKRQFRSALGTMAISLAMFFVAIVVSVKPAMFINLPNNASVMVQAIIVKSFTGELAGDTGICSTDMGSSPIGLQDGTSKKEDQDFLEGVAANMRSSIGCTFWQTFVFKPWAEGQWGSSWNETWAKGKIPSWAPKGSKDLQYTNGEMVGDPVVPLGNGKTIENWAVFNLSTMTNAHSPVGHEGNFSKYSQAVAHDWWRIVDMLTNYEETEAKSAITSAETGKENVKYTVPKGNPTLEQWDTWNGNNPGTRFASAISSLFIGAFGLIAPMFFGLMAAVYSLGMTIVMVFLPVMLLFGAWGGRGFTIFKQWVSLLWNIFTKRIAVGIMLMFSIILTNAAIVIMDTISWWKGALMLVVLTFVLIKSRHKMADMMAASNSGGLARIANRISQSISETGKAVGGIATSTVSGAAYSKFKGGTLKDGATIGMKQEFSNLSYRTPFLRDVRIAQQSLKSARGDTLHDADGRIITNCSLCQEPIEDGAIVKMGANGLWYCQFCSESEIEIDGGVEMIYRSPDSVKSSEKLKTNVVKPINNESEQASGGKLATELESKLGGLKYKDNVPDEELSEKALEKKKAMKQNRAENALNTSVSTMADTVSMVREGRVSEESLYGSNIPVELQPYLDSSMIKALVENGDWEAVSSAYIAAYTMAFQEAIEGKFRNLMDGIEMDFDQILKSKLAAAQGDYRTTSDLTLRESQLNLPLSERKVELKPMEKYSQDS